MTDDDTDFLKNNLTDFLSQLPHAEIISYWLFVICNHPTFSTLHLTKYLTGVLPKLSLLAMNSEQLPKCPTCTAASPERCSALSKKPISAVQFQRRGGDQRNNEFMFLKYIPLLSICILLAGCASVPENPLATSKAICRYAKENPGRAAEHPNAPAELLDALATNKSDFVYMAVANNLNTTSATLAALAKRIENNDLPKRGYFHYESNNPNNNYRDAQECLALAIVGNPNCPLSLIPRLKAIIGKNQPDDLFDRACYLAKTIQERHFNALVVFSVKPRYSYMHQNRSSFDCLYVEWVKIRIRMSGSDPSHDVVFSLNTPPPVVTLAAGRGNPYLFNPNVVYHEIRSRISSLESQTKTLKGH